jgi:hypothetical protein
MRRHLVSLCCPAAAAAGALAGAIPRITLPGYMRRRARPQLAHFPRYALPRRGGRSRMHSGRIFAAPKARGTKGAPTTSLPGISAVRFHVRPPRRCSKTCKKRSKGGSINGSGSRRRDCCPRFHPMANKIAGRVSKRDRFTQARSPSHMGRSQPTEVLP